MTDPMRDLAPEADVVEQQTPVDDTAEPVLDVDYLQDRSGADANAADLVEQAIDVPLPDDDRA
jgi:hypothetical protein